MLALEGQAGAGNRQVGSSITIEIARGHGAAHLGARDGRWADGALQTADAARGAIPEPQDARIDASEILHRPADGQVVGSIGIEVTRPHVAQLDPLAVVSRLGDDRSGEHRSPLRDADPAAAAL